MPCVEKVFGILLMLARLTLFAFLLLVRVIFSLILLKIGLMKEMLRNVLLLYDFTAL